jgi:NADP-dependent 3-hydroxy acid dehydrogenase YdfG
MKTIFGTLYAVYNKDEKALVTITGGIGDTALRHSIVADTDIALAARRMEALQQVGLSRLCLVKVEVNVTEIL